MKLTCLSKGNGFHFPSSHILEISGFRILLDCPLDLSALSIFSPIPTDFYQTLNRQSSDSLPEQPLNSHEREKKKQKIEKPLEVDDLIRAEPWYKTVANLYLWDLSSIDVVLISSAMGMLGLPFLTRNDRFSGKIYATEATARLGKLMMEELVSMHMEFRQFYGPVESGSSPEWMKWEVLESLHFALRKIAMGNDGSELSGWQLLYSAADVKGCMEKVQTLKYAEEACYNGTLIIKAFSSGLEIGASNWTISSSISSIAYLSSSIFYSLHAMGFDYQSLQGNDLILFSDFSSFTGAFQNPMSDEIMNISDKNICEEAADVLASANDGSEEMEKIAFICSCAIDSVTKGSSVLIPFGRLGIILPLLEQMFTSLESSSLEVPIFMISSIAEEMLEFTNVVPEWLCKERQQKLYSGEALFGHGEFIKKKKLHLFPAIHSAELVMMWQEPCIVFAPHWSLRFGPVIPLLRRWCCEPNSLLVLEQGMDAELALLPFKPVSMRILQCSFVSGIMMQKLQPLLEILQPKLILFPKDSRLQLPSSDRSSYSLFPYSENETVCVPNLRNDYEAKLETDLAYQLQPRMIEQRNIAVARLKGKLELNNGELFLASSKESNESPMRHLQLHWGSLDPNALLKALQEKGINGSLDVGSNDVCVLHILDPNVALIEIHAMHTVISSADETLSSLLVEAITSVLDGI